MADKRKYEVEVWWQGNTKLGEIGRLINSENSFSWTETRNGVGGIDFNIDMGVLREYCSSIGEDPKVFLQYKNTDIKLKRYGEYRMGGFVNDFPNTNFNTKNSTVSVSADGYLNLLADQITQNTAFKNTETTEIVWDLVNGVSSRPGATLGITKDNTNWFATGINRDRTYDNDQYVKDLVVALTSLGDGSSDFDFRFSPFRSLQTFDFNNPIFHKDIIVSYPAPKRGAGAIGMSADIAFDIVNRVIVKGSGQGESTKSVTKQDNESISQYGIHESVVSYSDVSEESTLSDKADAILAAKAWPSIIPSLMVNGSEFNISNIHAGDVITVNSQRSLWFDIGGLYRIEEMKVAVDKNNNEDVSLKLSNVGLSGAKNI